MQERNNQEPKANSRIRKGDKVMAITGNDRGKVGTVLSRKGDRLVVQGLNIRKKHVKRSQLKPKGDIMELEFPIHASNLTLVDPQDKPIKVKVRINKKGEREQYYVDGGRQVLFRSEKTAK